MQNRSSSSSFSLKNGLPWPGGIVVIALLTGFILFESSYGASSSYASLFTIAVLVADEMDRPQSAKQHPTCFFTANIPKP
jgi:hypothetical protein